MEIIRLDRNAELVRDRRNQNNYRVEYIDGHGGCEVAIFSGPDAMGRAVCFADAYYGPNWSDRTIS